MYDYIISLGSEQLQHLSPFLRTIQKIDATVVFQKKITCFCTTVLRFRFTQNTR